MSVEPNCVWALGAELGEGPVWSPRDNALWFVDIKKRLIHRYRPGEASNRSYGAPDQPGFALPHVGGDLVVGLPGKLTRFDSETGVFEPLVAVEWDRPGNRLNDGFVDALGRLWFGSMHDAEEAPTGALYSWTGALRQHVDGIVITNGPCTSPDGRTFYHTDTLAKTISAYDLSPQGVLSHGRVLITIEDGAGWPDGTVVDAEGCLWVGLFGGWAARRYSPAGELLQVVRFPCANITKLAFGGDEGLDLYATTAAKGLSAEDRAAQPLAGGLFHFKATVPGQAPAEIAYG
ncbi:MAG: SMP-30/gluconolactonase/LRE family protein [Azospirillaceae bacterium]|nr:SMP-30/gluconolactonase/LRE family protein [Azospirillaceae bacterium]